MRTAILAAALLPAPALAVPVQYHCAGTAEGANGERVEVIHYYDASAKREGQSANWDPPARVDGAPGDGAPDLALTLFFAEPTAAGPGASSSASMTATAFAAPGSRGSKAVERKLDGAVAEFAVDGGAPSRLPLERDARIMDLPMTAMRYAALDALPGDARDLAVRLLDRRGKILSAVRFDLSDTARRDGLYREAWAKAEEAGRDPAKCPAAEE